MVADLEAARLADVRIPMSVAPVPASSVAFWKRLAKMEPVEPSPMLEMGAKKVLEIPADAMAGETKPAVRSGVPQPDSGGTVTEQRPLHWIVPAFVWPQELAAEVQAEP